jgi:hypothetical protein
MVKFREKQISPMKNDYSRPMSVKYVTNALTDGPAFVLHGKASADGFGKGLLRMVA